MVVTDDPRVCYMCRFCKGCFLEINKIIEHLEIVHGEKLPQSGNNGDTSGSIRDSSEKYSTKDMDDEAVAVMESSQSQIISGKSSNAALVDLTKKTATVSLKIPNNPLKTSLQLKGPVV